MFFLYLFRSYFSRPLQLSTPLLDLTNHIEKISSSHIDLIRFGEKESTPDGPVLSLSHSVLNDLSQLRIFGNTNKQMGA